MPAKAGANRGGREARMNRCGGVRRGKGAEVCRGGADELLEVGAFFLLGLGGGAVLGEDLLQGAAGHALLLAGGGKDKVWGAEAKGRVGGCLRLLAWFPRPQRGMASARCGVAGCGGAPHTECADYFAGAFARAVGIFAAGARRGAMQALLVGLGCGGVLGLLPGFDA